MSEFAQDRALLELYDALRSNRIADARTLVRRLLTYHENKSCLPQWPCLLPAFQWTPRPSAAFHMGRIFGALSIQARRGLSVRTTSREIFDEYGAALADLAEVLA